MSAAVEAMRTVVADARRAGVAETVRSPAGPDPVTPHVIDLSFEEAFDELYARAYGVGFQLLGVRSEAEDVAQETLARAFARWRTVGGYAEAWIVRVAGNLAIDIWRRRRRITHSAAPEVATPGPDSQRVDLHRALAGLSKRQREVVVLRYLADLPEADVARAIGCSTGSVKVHAARGIAALRIAMGAPQEVA
ncbi:MAG: sigma-70 family RNA polymerase sigma factor [Acidimicrobiia bacterium]